jgi:hypothetical protein
VSYHFWFDIDGNPITAEEADRLLRDIDARRVALDQIDGWEISTVHLVVGIHEMCGPPLTFETMIFDPDGNPCWEERYPTKHAALAGHDQVMAAIRSGAIELTALRED